MGKYAFSKLNEIADDDDQKKMVRLRPFSYLTFGWMSNIMRVGNKQPLENDDLFTTDDLPESEEVVDKLEKQWNIEREISKSSGAKPRLWRAVIRMNSPMFYCAIVGWLFLVLFSFIIQPVFLSFLLVHMQYRGKEETWMVYLYLMGIAISTLSMSLFHNVYVKTVTYLCVQIRTALMSVVYKKVQVMSATSLANINSGRVINLVSKDLEPLMDTCFLGSYVILAPLQIVVVSLLLWWLAGWKAVLGIPYTFLLTALQMGSSRILQNLRLQTMPISDARVRLISDMISGVRHLKANALEGVFNQKIQRVRRCAPELQCIITFGVLASAFIAIAAVAIALLHYDITGCTKETKSLLFSTDESPN